MRFAPSLTHGHKNTTSKGHTNHWAISHQKSLPSTCRGLQFSFALTAGALHPALVYLYNYNKLKKTIISKLTWQEELVFKLKEQNYKPKEISEIIDNNQRTVYNIISRIRKKVSSIVSNKNNY